MKDPKSDSRRLRENVSSLSLRRKLGFAAVAAIVAGNMLGSGIFFTPGELASVTTRNWQVYFFWGLAGVVTLCGALTLAELSSKIPESGSSYHIIRKAYGPFWGFLKIWTEMWISGPVSIAGGAIVFGQFFLALVGPTTVFSPVSIGITAILFFTAINLLGVQWGGRTQILLTSIKLLALLALVAGSVLLVPSISSAGVNPPTADLDSTKGLFAILRVMGLGVAAVLFTYDGWIDVTHTAGEVNNPEKNLPRGLTLGVGVIILLYLLVNFAYLRVVPLAEMRAAPTLVASNLASKTFGYGGGTILTSLVILSICGSLGGLIMTLPRLFYGSASEYEKTIRKDHPARFFFQFLSRISSASSVPVGSILFSAAMSCIALLTFRSFGKLANFLVVPLQLINILLVGSIYRLRKKNEIASGYKTPGYPVVPFIYIFVMSLFLLSAIYFNPWETLMGVLIMATAIPIFFWVHNKTSAGKT